MRALVGALVLCSAWATATRVQDWRSDEALWQAAVVTTPSFARPWLRLAGVLARQGRWDEARDPWGRANDAVTRDPAQRTLCRDLLDFQQWAVVMSDFDWPVSCS